MTPRDAPASAGNTEIAAAGRTCWRTMRAERLSFLIDAAAYFRAFKSAALQARHSILIAGWDVDSRTQLEFAHECRPEVPNELGPLLDHLASRRDGPEIHVLAWDSPRLYSPDREWLPQARFDWFTHPRLCFALDDQHPFGASHHQKIVVIDDSIAFVGGMDLTVERLDDPDHLPDDPRRRGPEGRSYGPVHDLQVAVGGPVARAIGDVARDRWSRATGQRLRPVGDGHDSWPDDLAVDLHDVEVSIARTYPSWKGRQEVREIEELLLASIEAASETIYIENQYFASSRVAQALLKRLERGDCPEIVLVLPDVPSGWLEQTTMGVRRRQLLARLRDADRDGRIRAYVPVVGDRGEVPVKVHSKVMITDGRFIRIGSANLNNRSMGLDSECDLWLEGPVGSETARRVSELRNRLLAEHLDTSPDRVAREIDEGGSLIRAVEVLMGPGRSLVRLTDHAPDEFDAILADAELFDPTAPAAPERLADELISDENGHVALRKSLLQLSVVVAALLGLAVLWRWGPLSAVADVATIEAWAASFRESWAASLVLLAVYVMGGLVMFPVVVLIATTGLIFEPVQALAVAGAGSLLGAATGYAAGTLLGRGMLRRLSGRKIERISRQLAHRGVLHMTVIRLLPLAPFTLINLAAGASHISFRDFMAGTVLGMAPGIVTLTLFSSQLGRTLRQPDALNLGLLAAVLVMIGGAVFWAWRRFVRRPGEAAGD